ncbi:MAG: hypothetical protein ACR2PW_03745 [Gammaproteobacteria bacterium]
MRQSSRSFGVLLLLMLATVPMSSRAQTVLEITGGSKQLWRIAAVPFAWQIANAEAFDPAQTVEQDLIRYSGFQPVPRPEMPSFPDSVVDIVRWDWLVLDADFVLTGQISHTDQALPQLSWELYDVSQDKRVLDGTFVDDGQGIRHMAHRISDRIHRYVLGVPSASIARFVYISVTTNLWGQKLYRLMQADADGGNQKILFSSNEPILAPNWSPDGRRVVFSTIRSGNLRIQILDLATGRMRYLGPWGGNSSDPVFSPSGDYLALTLSKDTNPDIYIYHIETGSLQRLTRHFAIDAEPVWALSGTQILFTSDRSGNPQLYRFNLLSGVLDRVTFFEGQDGGAQVMSNGREAIFLRSKGALSWIAHLDLETLHIRDVSEQGSHDSPAISPDGNVVLYSDSGGQSSSLVGLLLKGGHKFRLENIGSQVKSPAWSPLYR